MQGSMPPFAANVFNPPQQSGFGFNPMQSYGPPPGFAERMQAQQKFQQSSPYMDFMNKQKALQQEFEGSQAYKDFQSQMQRFDQQQQPQQQQYFAPMQMYGGMNPMYMRRGPDMMGPRNPMTSGMPGGLAGLFGAFRGIK